MVACLGQALLDLAGALVGVVRHWYPGEQSVEQALLLQAVGEGARGVQELELYYRAGRDDACG
jgi:hypothetical protein